MSHPSGSRWPAAIKPRILTPSVILEQQARALAGLTKGVLTAQVTRQADEDRKELHLHLDVIAPALDYRRRVLSMHHKLDMPYPVLVDFPSLANPLRPSVLDTLEGRKPPNQATTDDELLELIGTALSRPEIESHLVSLIAWTTEKLGLKEEQQRETAPDSSEKEDGTQGG